MNASKLATMIAILSTAAGSAALAGRAQAQISGTIGGDVVQHGTPPVLGSPFLTGAGVPDYVTILANGISR